MSTTTNLDTLKINYLTRAQYTTALNNSSINENEIYLTPDTSGVTETSVTIAANSWSNSSATVTVSGVTSSSTIWVAPAEASYDAYVAAGIRATAQGTNSVTFVCTTTPTTSITVNIAVSNNS